MKVVLITANAVVLCLILSESFGAKGVDRQKTVAVNDGKNQMSRSKEDRNSEQPGSDDSLNPVCLACGILDRTKNLKLCIKEVQDFVFFESLKAECKEKEAEICRKEQPKPSFRTLSFKTPFPLQWAITIAINPKCLACYTLVRSNEFKQCIKEKKDIEFTELLQEYCTQHLYNCFNMYM